jgi:hypothetical protein
LKRKHADGKSVDWGEESQYEYTQESDGGGDTHHNAAADSQAAELDPTGDDLTATGHLADEEEDDSPE